MGGSDYRVPSGAQATSRATDWLRGHRGCRGGEVGQCDRGAASLGVTGTAALVLFQHQSLRYAAAVGLFVFGIIMLCLALGMRVVALRLSAATSGDQQIVDHG